MSNQSTRNPAEHNITPEHLLTPENYAEKTAEMKSLVWPLTKRDLEVNHLLAMYLSDDHNVAVDHSGHLQDSRSIEHLLAFAWNETKLPPESKERLQMQTVQEKLGYTFVSERLLLQAFTRRSFHTDGMLRGADYEVLEVAGDAVMSAAVMKIILRQHARFLGRDKEGELYFCDYDEGDVSRIKQKYTSKDHLVSRCIELDFDKFIRYGTDDDQSKSDSKEDILEAIVGAVAVDSGWDMDVIEGVVETLLDIHLDFDPWDASVDKFDVLNSWWQRRFGCRPDYRVRRSTENDPQGRALYECDLVFHLPDLDDRDWNEWFEDVTGYVPLHEHCRDDVVFHSRRISRSEARSMCAEAGLHFIKAAGLFMNLKETGITPSLEDSINQLQILHQRGYIGEPVFEFFDADDYWECKCKVDSFWDSMDAPGKKESKRKAAFAVLIQIMRSAGINDPEWDKIFEE